ncbi:cytidine deaminase [Synchytrium microbalum]|uniref:cytidine deaminase n=1 Tax=Synchytrium microbalum TaxID=1806994 RepID=A0A507C3L0_9FUNG|nr:cytidine deaminase [Synchytrium microbalum]TPX32145.1 cytidine deaminase [Synchytrium microbalum]
MQRKSVKSQPTQVELRQQFILKSIAAFRDNRQAAFAENRLTEDEIFMKSWDDMDTSTVPMDSHSIQSTQLLATSIIKSMKSDLHQEPTVLCPVCKSCFLREEYGFIFCNWDCGLCFAADLASLKDMKEELDLFLHHNQPTNEDDEDEEPSACANPHGYPWWPCLVLDAKLEADLPVHIRKKKRGKDVITCYHFGEAGDVAWYRPSDMREYEDFKPQVLAKRPKLKLWAEAYAQSERSDALTLFDKRWEGRFTIVPAPASNSKKAAAATSSVATGSGLLHEEEDDEILWEGENVPSYTPISSKSSKKRPEEAIDLEKQTPSKKKFKKEKSAEEDSVDATIDSKTMEQIIRTGKLDTKTATFLNDMARHAKENSYSPYSKFRVGAALLLKSGKIYMGCNVENVSFGASICAERTAVVKAVSEGHRDFIAIAVASDLEDYITPCGICRQFICEFGKNIIIQLTKLNGQYKTKSIDDLLPGGFTSLT